MLGLQIFLLSFSKIFCWTLTVSRQKFVQYICMKYFGFIDVFSTVKVKIKVSVPRRKVYDIWKVVNMLFTLVKAFTNMISCKAKSIFWNQWYLIIRTTQGGWLLADALNAWTNGQSVIRFVLCYAQLSLFFKSNSWQSPALGLQNVSFLI